MPRSEPNTCTEHRYAVVVYTDTVCPLCEAEEQLEIAKQEKSEVESRLDSEKDYVKDLESRINVLEQIAYKPESDGRLFREES